MSKKNLPVLELRINPKKGSLVNAIAIVGAPATGSNFLAFSKQDSAPVALKFEANDERMELIGAAMIPGLAMYRNTKEFGEYMSVFYEDTIREIAQVFAERGFFNNMNIDHTTTSAKSYVFQSYIVDEKLGIAPPKGLDVPNGTWIVGVKVNDAQVWEDIKSGKTNGFSVEGLFDMFDTEMDLELEFQKALIEYFSEKKGCLMFFPDVDADQWRENVKKIVPNPTELELEPHITLLYGFEDNDGLTDFLKQFVQEALSVAPLSLALGSLSKFTNDNDVVKIDIMDMSGTLYAINGVLSEVLQIVSEYGEYKPHMTLAYTEPRPETVYSGDLVKPWEFGINYLSKGRIVYSNANGEHTDILTIK